MTATRKPLLGCLACGQAAAAQAPPFRCENCGSTLLVVRSDAPSSSDIFGSGEGIWRFGSVLPLVPEALRTSLGEGGSPLVATTIGGTQFWVKNEGVSPTGSYKDRFNAVNVSVARALGAVGITLTSTGNAGLSAATYAARAGLPARVYCPRETPKLIHDAIAATGAQVTSCSPAHARSAVASDVAAGWFPGSRAVPADNSTPFGCEGYKTISYEIVETLGRVPTEVVVPVGGGDGVFGIGQGFEDLRRAGLIDSGPRLIGARTTWLGALSIARDEVGEHAVRAIADTGGELCPVTQNEIVDAASALARTGISAEPASAAAVAALLKLTRSPGATVVCVITGNGLKWPCIVKAPSSGRSAPWIVH